MLMGQVPPPGQSDGFGAKKKKKKKKYPWEEKKEIPLEKKKKRWVWGSAWLLVISVGVTNMS